MKKNCFLLLLHSFEDQQKSLIKYISNYSDVYIHVDKKSEHIKNEITDWILKNSLYNSIFIVDNNIKVFWGDNSILLAVVNLFKYIYKNKKQYSFYTLLSGECFPIQPLEEFLLFLENNIDKNFMRYDHSQSYSNRIENIHLGMKNTLFRKVKLYRYFMKLISISISFFYKQKFYGLKIYKGSTWFTLNNQFSSYFINYLDDEKIKKLKYSLCSDEVVIHTILKNSMYNESIIDDNYMFVKWRKKMSPDYLSLHDIESINKSYFFARKISFIKHPDIKDFIFNKLGIK